VHQARNILRLGLLDELDGRGEVHAEVLRPMVRYRYLKVLNLPRLLEHIRQRRHVQYVANVVLLDFCDVLAVCGVAQEEPREDFNRLPTVRLQGIVGSAFAIG
jgi:hypothetical protein